MIFPLKNHTPVKLPIKLQFQFLFCSPYWYTNINKQLFRQRGERESNKAGNVDDSEVGRHMNPFVVWPTELKSLSTKGEGGKNKTQDVNNNRIES